jgi:Tol biopolymer transport system component/DNA-binding winged helix-turn-helix (wHTH) protein
MCDVRLRTAVRYRWDDFLIDLDAYRLERAGSPVPLEPKALDVLALMVQRPGHLFSKQELFDRVWAGTAVTDHALTRVVAQLRRALGDEAREARYIETVPTRGYRWVRPVVSDEGAFTSDTSVRPMDSPVTPAVTTSEAAPAFKASRRAGLALVASMAAASLGAVVWFWAGPTPAGSAAEGAPAAYRSPLDPAHPVSWPMQLTTHAGLDLHPSFSPQGDALAFASDRSGAMEIYVRALTGSAVEAPLTSDGGENLQPDWSPDGRLIAYHSAGRGGIWIVPARGGTPRQVAATGSQPAWSPDGRRIAFQSDEHADVSPSAHGAQSGSIIKVVEAEVGTVGDVTRAGQPTGGHASPQWTPDGRWLVFPVFDAGRDKGIAVVEVESGEARLIYRGEGLFELAFSPDGSVLYAAGGEALIARLPFDSSRGTVTGRAEIIPVAGVQGARGLSMSADGTRLAFSGIALNSQIWVQPVTPEGAADGPARALTTDTARRTSMAAVSPDGSRVAFMSSRRGQPPNVWVVGIDGSERVQISQEGSVNGDPRWLADGRRIAYRSSRGDGFGIWVADVDTRREELLLDAAVARRSRVPALAGHLAELALSPSLSRIAFSLVVPPSSHRRLFVTGVPEFVPRAITDGSSWIGYPAWSPDERRLAVEIKSGSVIHAGVVDVATGSIRQLTSVRGQTWVRSWSPDGRRIAAAALREGRWSLRWIDAEAGREDVITPPVPPGVYLRYPDWSPRGDLIAFERGELTGNIWTLGVK